MQAKNGQAATGLVILFWGIFLLIVIIIGTTLMFLVRDGMGNNMYQDDRTVNWEAGYLSHSLAQSRVNGIPFTTYIQNPSIDELYAHLDSYIKKTSLDSQVWFLGFAIVQNDAVLTCIATPIQVGEGLPDRTWIRGYAGIASDECTDFVWREGVTPSENVKHLSTSSFFPDQDVGVVALPDEAQTFIVTIVRKSTT